MGFFKSVVSFFKRLFEKKEQPKLIESKLNSDLNKSNPDFIEKIKINNGLKNDAVAEVRVCYRRWTWCAT